MFVFLRLDTNNDSHNIKRIWRKRTTYSVIGGEEAIVCTFCTFYVIEQEHRSPSRPRLPACGPGNGHNGKYYMSNFAHTQKKAEVLRLCFLESNSIHFHKFQLFLMDNQ